MPDLDIVKNLLDVKKRIKKVSISCRRNPDDVRLVAVSKKISPEKIKTALDAGVGILGENYIQEAQKKIAGFGNRDVSWHFIGHLQSNKAKLAVDLFDMIHSVDSFHLAESLNREARKNNKNMDILVQANVSGEHSKHGLDPNKILQLLKEISSLSNLSVQGLMTMPPLSDNPENSRPFFALLRKLRDELASSELKYICLKELSMGMSSDFEVAIEEGSTLVRVGTSIFGPRN